MKKQLIGLSFAFLACFATINAQDLPKPSPMAKVEQRVGLTDVSVTYSRPGTNGRDIWGGLVPYNEIWRAGANKATMLSTTAPIKINGQTLAAGDYSVFIIPVEKGDWTVIINKETELWGAGEYKEEQDALRLEVAPEIIEWESSRLEFHFTEVNMSAAILVMDWAGKRIALNIDADPSDQVMKNIAEALETSPKEDLWKVYRSAAAYAKDNNMTTEGLEWIQASIALMENWYSYWVYASLLANSGDKKAAVEKANQAITIGKKSAEDAGSTFGYEERIKADIEKWN